MLTLWDLLPKRKQEKAEEASSPPKPAPPVCMESGASPNQRAMASRSVAMPPQQATPPRPANGKPAPREPMRDRYERMQREMLAHYRVRVRKWRSSSTGVAWQVFYKDGSVARLIESPKPRGPISAAVFLHEIGHHAIGFGVHKPRCLEEYHAWRFSLEHMERYGITITPAVERRVRESLQYAVDKARRRGLRRIPHELLRYLPGEPGVS